MRQVTTIDVYWDRRVYHMLPGRQRETLPRRQTKGENKVFNDNNDKLSVYFRTFILERKKSLAPQMTGLSGPKSRINERKKFNEMREK